MFSRIPVRSFSLPDVVIQKSIINRESGEASQNAGSLIIVRRWPNDQLIPGYHVLLTASTTKAMKLHRALHPSD